MLPAFRYAAQQRPLKVITPRLTRSDAQLVRPASSELRNDSPSVNSKNKVLGAMTRSISSMSLYLYTRDNFNFSGVLGENKMEQLRMLRRHYDQSLAENARVYRSARVNSIFFVYPVQRQPEMRPKSIFIPVLSDFFQRQLAANKLQFILSVQDIFRRYKETYRAHAVRYEYLNKIELSFADNDDFLTSKARKTVQAEREVFYKIFDDGEQFFNYVVCIKWQNYHFYNCYLNSPPPVRFVYDSAAKAIQRQAYLLRRKRYEVLLSVQYYNDRNRHVAQ